MKSYAKGVLGVALSILALGSVAAVTIKHLPQGEREPDPLVQSLAQRIARLEERIKPKQLVERLREGLDAEAKERAESIEAREREIVAALRAILVAQAQFQQSGKADTDGEGIGEYGGFLELSGAAKGRMSAALAPPVLPAVYRVLNVNGEATQGGYFFRIYLPGPHGGGVGEPQSGYPVEGARVDEDLAETTWCAYAWPAVHGRTGARTFFVNQFGDVTCTDDERYSGTGRGPAPAAAFTIAQSITGTIADGTRGSDGNLWTRVR